MTVQTKDSRIWYTVPLKMMPESPERSWMVEVDPNKSASSNVSKLIFRQCLSLSVKVLFIQIPLPQFFKLGKGGTVKHLNNVASIGGDIAMT